MATEDPEYPILGNVECFHHFETHCLLRSPGTASRGKDYKEWIFRRVANSDDDPQKVVAGGVKVRVREVARWLANTEGQARMRRASELPPVSLDEPINESDVRSRYDVEEFLQFASPDDHAAMADYCELAERHAERTLPTLSDQQRTALTADGLSLSFTDPRVHAAAKMGRSELYRHLSEADSRLATSIGTEYRDEGQTEVDLLVQLCQQFVRSILIEQAAAAPPETPAFKLLMLVKKQPTQ